MFVATLATASGQTGAQSVQESLTIHGVAAGETVDSDLSGGQQAQYSFDFAQDEFATVVVSHRNIALTIRVIGPEASELVEISSDGPDGDLRLPVHARRPGRVRFEVAASYPKSPTGTYTFSIDGGQAATASDRQVADALMLQSKAVTFRRQDDFARALSFAQEALALSEKPLAAESPQIVRMLLLVAQLEDIRANFASADSLYRRAQLLLKGWSPQTPLLEAQVLDAHAANLIARGHYGEAAPLAGEALAIRESVVGPAHFLVAASLGTLADLQHESAKVQEAAATAERALAIAAAWYRPTDIVFGDFSNRVARSQLALGNFARAEQLYRESLAARETAAGPASLAAAESLGGLARVSLLSNDNGPSEERHLASLAIRERALGPGHPQVANDLMNLV